MADPRAHLDRVTVNATTSRAAALAAYARVSRKGARLLRRRAGASTEATPLGPLVLPFRYAPGSGVLHVALRAYRAARRRRAALAETAPVTATPQP